MGPQILPIIVGIGVLGIFVLGLLVMIARFYRKVDQGRALIVNTMRSEPVVTFTGKVVVPIIHRAEVMDISVKTIEIDRRGTEGLICFDNIRADIKVTFFVRVNKTADDVLKVAQSIGCARASDQQTIEELFSAKFSEALKTVGKQLDFEDLYNKREHFRDQIIALIGQDLNGFVLEDAAIDYLEQTPVEHLDANNILDSQGIRKITEITATQNVRTNELRQKERMDIGHQDLTADEAIFQFDQRRAEAEAKKQKEIAIAQSREQNEAARVADDEQKRTLILRTKHQEEIEIANEAKLRGVEIAEKNRERELAVEAERVTKARELEMIARERETSLGRIAKDKEVEVQKKEIADVVRARIAVDKTVAEEEERIKDLRVVADAKRNKDATVISAEAAAEEQMLRVVKAAEAKENVTRLEAKEHLVRAEAALEAADKEARAKIRLAEGVQAESAAEGLAAARVKEATATASEKEGLAQVRVREANAAAIQKEGVAEAEVIREKMAATAIGEEQQGVAQAKINEALATAAEKQGLVDAQIIEKKLTAEAAGLAEKANAMKALDGVGREHEEFRLKLEKETEIELAKVATRERIAEAQASVMSAAMGSAKINIVGGDGEFFDKFINAVSLGQSTDGFLNNSESVQKLLGEYLNGGKSLPADLKEILSRPSIDSDTVRNLATSALMAKATKSDVINKISDALDDES